ncbi:hypothetical protein [Streptomyces sp. NPDC059010]|uniref:hypothetical protein n=1 Tax=Streptomyces sp. NPDC059010 TaxID=3346695 RepID=UPI0036871966
MLADALDLDSGGSGIDFERDTGQPENQVLGRLCEDFCTDVLSQLCDEWRHRPGVILRWRRAWYPHYGMDQLPPILRHLPPIRPAGRRHGSSSCLTSQ